MERGGRGKSVETFSSLTPYRIEVSQWGDSVMTGSSKEDAQFMTSTQFFTGTWIIYFFLCEVGSINEFSSN